MNKIILLYIVVLVTLLISGFNNSSQEQANSKITTLKSLFEASKIMGENRTDFTKFSDIIMGVKFEYPSPWQLHYRSPNEIFLLVNYNFPYEDEGIRDVFIQRLPLDKDYVTVEEFTREYLSGENRPIVGSYTYFHIIDFNKTKLADNDAIELVTTYYYNSSDIKENAYFYFIIMIDKEQKNAYVISYDENIKEYYDEDIAYVRHLINTFKLTGFE